MPTLMYSIDDAVRIVFDCLFITMAIHVEENERSVIQFRHWPDSVRPAEVRGEDGESLAVDLSQLKIQYVYEVQTICDR